HYTADFFFQAEDGIRSRNVTGVQTCALPIYPANLMGIEACQKIMPNTPQVAVFDTAFHMTMPPKAYIYAIPYEYYEKDDVRRYEIGRASCRKECRTRWSQHQH